MKKIKHLTTALILLVSLGFGMQVHAQNSNLETPSIGESEDNFPKIKEFVQLSIVERQKILDQEKDCVNKSKNKPELKQCFISAKESRKEMGRKLKQFKQNP